VSTAIPHRDRVHARQLRAAKRQTALNADRQACRSPRSTTVEAPRVSGAASKSIRSTRRHIRSPTERLRTETQSGTTPEQDASQRESSTKVASHGPRSDTHSMQRKRTANSGIPTQQRRRGWPQQRSRCEVNDRSHATCNIAHGKTVALTTRASRTTHAGGRDAICGERPPVENVSTGSDRGGKSRRQKTTRARRALTRRCRPAPARRRAPTP